MPRKRTMRRKKSTLSKKMQREVKKIAEKVVDAEIEDKSFVYLVENEQLYHNKPLYITDMLSHIGQGVNDGNQSTGASPGNKTIRIGNQISLKNINVRFWLSNKLDRPNVMYKGVLFWYPTGATVNDAFVFNTQSNKILDRYNDNQITIIDRFILRSREMYDNGTEKWEHSYLANLNKSYKNKKVTYTLNGATTKDFELGMCIVCYDAFGTLQTDNIASFAYNSLITFQDA